MKTLLLDIETAPNLADVWGLWQQNVSLNQLRESSYMLCFAWKWHGQDEVRFASVQNKDDMLGWAYDLLNYADAIVTWNGDNFDLPTMRQELLLAGYAPPASPKSIDLCKAVKKQFRFPSNKLDYVSQALGFESKVKHSGHELWQRVMRNEPEAWAEFEEYNRKDVVLLEPIYDRLKPWIPNHPNVLLYEKDILADLQCTRCTSAAVRLRGYARLITGRYRRYVCTECGAWSRSTNRVDEVKMVGV